MRNSSLILLIALSFLASCGYQWQPDYPHQTRPAITVPFVKGDEDGSFTAEIVKAISASGLADVVSFGGQYRMEIEILKSSFENIGYRIDPQKVNGKVRRNLLASEGRKIIEIEVALYRGDDLAYGPYTIRSDTDYDFVDGDSFQDLTFTSPSGALVTVLPFSLGQLESVGSAQLAATKPLQCRLARKTVDAILSEW